MGECDEFREYLAEAMEDPLFRLEYERAEWITARWWRRLLNRYRWCSRLLPRLPRSDPGQIDLD